jgi:WhiB family redox-sensing transcriptional regulator
MDSTTKTPASARWRDRAACAAPGVDLALFFPDPGERGKVAKAKRVCAGCPVRGACLAEALSLSWNRDYGIRGGTTREERRRPAARRAA